MTADPNVPPTELETREVWRQVVAKNGGRYWPETKPFEITAAFSRPVSISADYGTLGPASYSHRVTFTREIRQAPDGRHYSVVATVHGRGTITLVEWHEPFPGKPTP